MIFTTASFKLVLAPNGHWLSMFPDERMTPPMSLALAESSLILIG